MKKEALFCLILISFSFSTLLWRYSTNSPIVLKPIVENDHVIFASEKGTIYSIRLNAANAPDLAWKITIEGTPNELLQVDNQILVSTSNGYIDEIKADGSKAWETNLAPGNNIAQIFGVGTNQNYIYVSTDNGIYKLGKNGNLISKIYSYESTVVSAPAVGSNYIIFGKGRDIIKLTEAGTVSWDTIIAKGNVVSAGQPRISGSLIYAGGFDNALHAISLGSGTEYWKINTDNWVMSTPFEDNGGITYFGDNSGNIYAIDSGGQMVWNTKTSLAIYTQGEIGTMGGKNVVFFGSSDKNIYALDSASGDIVWKETTGGAVGNPIFYQNEIIFGSEDNTIYGYSTESACSIYTPKDGEIIGQKEVEVRGKFVSQNPDSQVYLSINGNVQWDLATTNGNNWTDYLDPQLKLNPGLNTISCRIDQESGDRYTTVGVNYDSNSLPGTFILRTNGIPLQGNQYTISAYDSSDGTPINRITLLFNNKNYSGDGSIKITLPQAGKYTAIVKKTGFNDANLVIDVNSKGIDPLIVAGVVVIVIALLLVIWSQLSKTQMNKRK